MAVMRLACPKCAAVITAPDINIDAGAAECRSCGETIDVCRALGLSQPPTPPQPIIPTPTRMRHDDGAAAWTITWKWFTPAAISAMLFCVAWDGFLVFWYGKALRDREWSMAIFAIFHLAIGVGLTYTVAASFLNKTTVCLEPDALVIRHGPIPWRGNRRLPTDDIAHLYSRRDPKATGRRYDFPHGCHMLGAALKTGGEIPLLRFSTPAEASYLRREIETQLRIEPRFDAGECLFEHEEPMRPRPPVRSFRLLK